MYTLSVAVDVNPPGVTPRLTQDQVWRGLIIKAENAVLFVPRMQACTVIERRSDGLLREVVNDGHRFREKITFSPPVEVLFERVRHHFPASNTRLNGVSVARLNCEKPADETSSRSAFSLATAPKAAPP